jgi:uracil-DNA glycosylase family 4
LTHTFCNPYVGVGKPELLDSLDSLNDMLKNCVRCPRLVEHRQTMALVKRRAYREFDYWGKPVPGFGDPHARLFIVGLAPGAHGSNRTGRMFTGDKSGDFLYAALYKAGFCNQPQAYARNDGLVLDDTFISAVARCAPPANKPLPVELANCRDFLENELALLTSVKVLLALGKIAFDQVFRILSDLAETGSLAKPKFSHGSVVSLPRFILMASYHPSQQNTQTGRLTQDMFDQVFKQVRSYL